MGFIRATNGDPLAPHLAAANPHPQYLLTTGLPVELAAAFAMHIPGDPHPQYLLERSLALGLHHNILTSGAFDANTWSPNAGQAHKSAINVIHVIDIRRNAQGVSFSITNLNLPENQQRGLLIEIDPFADQLNSLMLLSPEINKTQIFIGFTNFGCFTRQQKFGAWDPWRRFIFGDSANSFSQLQKFTSGIQIGADAQATPVQRILTKLEMIDPPAVTPEGAYFQDVSVPGAKIGDFVQIIPVWERFALALWPFDFGAVVLADNLVRTYFRNEWTAALDLQNIQFRIMVTGF